MVKDKQKYRNKNIYLATGDLIDVDSSPKLIPLVASTSLEVLEGRVHRVRGILTGAVVIIFIYISMDSALLLMAFRKGSVMGTDLRLDGSFVCLADLRAEFNMLKLNMNTSGCVGYGFGRTTHSADEDVVALNRRQRPTLIEFEH